MAEQSKEREAAAEAEPRVDADDVDVAGDAEAA